MKIRRDSSIFEPTRRRRRLPILPVLAPILVVALLVVAWQRGGERPLTRIEKTSPADQLGK